MARKISEPSKKTLLQFGLVMFVGFGVLGGGALHRGRVHVALAFWTVAGVVPLLCLVAPSLARPLYRMWMRLGLLMGAVSSRVVMTIIYFAVLTPLAIFFRIKGRDALRRRKQNASTHWVDHPVIADKSYYERLF